MPSFFQCVFNVHCSPLILGRAGQKPLDYRDVKTTMIYIHVLNRGGRGIHSPTDRL
jgi:hypothetical protein